MGTTETGAVEQLGNVAKKGANAIKDLGTATMKTAGVFMLTKPSIESAVKNLPLLGTAAATAAKIIEGQVSQYQALTNAGANFGGNLAAITQNATAAGLSVKEMTGLIAGNSEALAGFGDSVESGMEGFLKNLHQMRKDGNQYGLQLRNIGLTHEEIGEAMILTERMRMMSGKRELADQATIQEATANYAKDLDLLSKLTGKNADELKKEQAALQRQGDFRAATMGMEVDMRQAILKSSSVAEASGIGDLFKDMMTKGFPSEDQRKLAGMMDNTMQVLYKMSAAKKRGDDEAFEALERDLEVAAIKDRLKKKELAALGNQTQATGALAQVYAKSADYSLAVEAKVAAGTLQESQIQAELKRMRDKGLAERKAQGGDVGPGQEGDTISDDRKVLNAALRGQEAMIEAAVQVQTNVTEKLYNQYLGPLFEGIANSSTAKSIMSESKLGMQAMGDWMAPGMTVASPGQTNADVQQIIARLDRVSLDQTKSDEIRNKATASSNNLADILQGGDKTNLEAALKDAKAILGDKAPGAVIPGDSNPRIDPKAGVVRRRGTPGMDQALQGFSTFASMTEDFGKQSLAFLHGKELVMTEEQAKLLDEGIKSLAEQAGVAFNQLQAQSKIDATSMKSLKESALSFQQSGSGNFAELARLGRGQATNASATRQGSINTIRNKGDMNQESDLKSQMSAMFEAMKMGQQDTVKQLELAMIASMPNKEVFDGLLETSKQQLGSTMQQLSKMDAGNKLTKKLSKLGNAFGGGISV